MRNTIREELVNHLLTIFKEKNIKVLSKRDVEYDDMGWPSHECFTTTEFYLDVNEDERDVLMSELPHVCEAYLHKEHKDIKLTDYCNSNGDITLFDREVYDLYKDELEEYDERKEMGKEMQ